MTEYSSDGYPITPVTEEPYSAAAPEYTIRMISVDAEVMGTDTAPNESLAWEAYEKMERTAVAAYGQAPELGALFVQLSDSRGNVLAEQSVGR